MSKNYAVYEEIGKTIVALRKQKNITQEELALLCRISASYLRRIEHGEANPSINELSRIAEKLQAEFRSPFAAPERAAE